MGEAAGTAMMARQVTRGCVAVVGLGKIGLPLAIQYAWRSYRVIGCDIDPRVVEGVNAGRAHVQDEPELEVWLAHALEQGMLSATRETAEAVRQANVVVVIVPVLINAQHEPDFEALDAATRAIGAGLRPGTLVIYETTVPVGTTRLRVARLLEEVSRLEAGRDFLLAYSPERVSSGRIFRDLASYPKVVGGINEASRAAAAAFYEAALDAQVLSMASTDDAEFVKLIETTYRDVNIALANEFARYADARGLDALAAIDAANSQPYAHIHTPGVGVGGHCIPVYPYFLMCSAPEGLSLPRQARIINDSMAGYAVQRIEAEIGPLAGRSVLILGVAYRGEVRATAFSSARRLQEALLARRAVVYVDDPLFSEGELRALGYTPLKPEQRGEITAIIAQANHAAYQSFDFRLFPRCLVVLDGRQAVQRSAVESCGIRYLSIGDGQGARAQFQ